MSENNEWNIVENLRIFQEIQKAKALVNTHKTYWKDVALQDLLDGLDREVIELKEAIRDGKIANTQLECADVANYAAMIFSKIRG